MSTEQIRVSSATVTETTTVVETATEHPTLKLRCHKPKTDKKVQWSQATVDNEHLNKKKSKCCCVYVKPKIFGESSSDEDDECEHCSGHVEKKKKKPIKQPNQEEQQPKS